MKVATLLKEITGTQEVTAKPSWRTSKVHRAIFQLSTPIYWLKYIFDP